MGLVSGLAYNKPLLKQIQELHRRYRQKWGRLDGDDDIVSPSYANTECK